MIHGSLFSGLAGFDLASEWMGWENVFHCEWNEFCRKILNYYWPEATSYDDITETDFTIWNGKIDILTGGFPCQPYSQAGKRRGKDDERHIWPEMLRAVREIKPRWVVGENVYGIVNWSDGLVFEEVQADLENEGYTVQPYILPAAGVGAPHQRYRVWFVAYRNNEERDWRGSSGERTRQKTKQRRNGVFSPTSRSGQKRTAPNPDNPRTNQRMRVNGNREAKDEGREGQPQPEFRENCRYGNAPDTSNQGLQGSEIKRSFERSRKERDKQFTGCFCPGWEKFPTQSPVCGRNDGISGRLDGITFPKWRNESIKGYGNAIVPQVAFQIFKTIQDYESTETG